MTDSGHTHAGRWRILAVLCVSLVVIMVDSTIVNVALPTFARELEATTSELQWIVDAYTLAITGLLLFAGALGDRFGRHHALAAGLLLFAAGSLLAAVSSSATELIGARVVMGIGAAAIMPSTLSILIDVFTEPAERAQAIGIWAGMSGLGVALGPTLGGWLLEQFAWGAVFLINLPIVAAALVAGRRLIPASRAPGSHSLDVVGATLAGAGLTALTWSLIAAPEEGWLSASTLGIAAAGALALGAFVGWERRRAQPLMDLRLFEDARFAGGSFAITLVFFVLFGALFAYTQILQAVLGHSALVTGLTALPMAAALAACAPASAAISRRIGTRATVAAGLIVMAAGLGGLASLTASSAVGEYAVALALMGAGIGLAIAPSTAAIMASVPLPKAGVGSAVNDTTRELGGVLGVAILGSLLASAYASELRPATESLDPSQAAAAEDSIVGALTTSQQLAPGVAEQLADAAREAFMTAAERGFIVAAALAVAGALVVLRWLPRGSTEPAHVHRPAQLGALGDG